MERHARRLRSDQEKRRTRTAKISPVYNYYETIRGRATAAYRAPRGFYSTLFKYARVLRARLTSAQNQTANAFRNSATAIANHSSSISFRPSRFMTMSSR